MTVGYHAVFPYKEVLFYVHATITAIVLILSFIDSKFSTFLVYSLILSFSGFMIYNLIASHNFLSLISIIISLLLLIPLYRRFVIIQGGTLRYKNKLIPLSDVAEIINEDVASGAHDGVFRHIVLIDANDEVLTHFRMEYLGNPKKINIFLQALKEANPHYVNSLDDFYMSLSRRELNFVERGILFNILSVFYGGVILLSLFLKMNNLLYGGTIVYLIVGFIISKYSKFT